MVLLESFPGESVAAFFILVVVMRHIAEQDFFKAQRVSCEFSHAGLGQECGSDWCDAYRFQAAAPDGLHR